MAIFPNAMISRNHKMRAAIDVFVADRYEECDESKVRVLKRMAQRLPTY